MKGLDKIPNQKKLSQAYKTLHFYPHSIRIKNLILWSQWARLDPRLGEILVEHIAKFWLKYNPVKLNQSLKLKAWPSAFGVLIEHVPFYQGQSLRGEKRSLFSRWAECAMADVPKAQNEQFFIGLYKAGGRTMSEERLFSIKPYRQWGYFAKDLLINKAQSQNTLIPLEQRRVIMDKLLRAKKTFTVQDYLEKANFQIHRRQAQRDLKNHKGIKSFGRTKGTYYTQSP